jgi:hypothetical protein
MSSYQDEVSWLDAARFRSRYFSSLPTINEDDDQAGGGNNVAEDDDVDDPQEGPSTGPVAIDPAADPLPLPILNRSGSVDTMGCPINNLHYESIPLSEDFEQLLDVRVKKVAFVRQKKWNLQDQLLRVIFLPKRGNPILLLRGLVGAVQQVIEFCLRKFKAYYLPREDEERTETQCYLKAGFFN